MTAAAEWLTDDDLSEPRDIRYEWPFSDDEILAPDFEDDPDYEAGHWCEAPR